MDNIDIRELRIISYIALVIVIFMLFSSFLGDITFRLTYINAKVKATTEKILNPQKDYPIQKNIPDTEQEIIEVRTHKREIYKLKTQAEYTITGLVVATNTNFFFT